MSKVVLECKNIKKKYKKKKHFHIASNDISFKLNEGEVLGIVGESGCGKSTLAKIIMNLEKADSGELILNGRNIINAKGKELKSIYKEIQMVFQDAQGSFNPRMTIGESIKEYVCSLCSKTKEEREEYVDELLALVGLPIEFKFKYPKELSGGQCQRAAIARALAAHPRVLICDEATSALDVSVQAQIIELLMKMKNEFGMSYIFISHDLALVSSFCDEVIVIKDGNIIESGKAEEVISNPKNEYTKELLKYV